MGYFDADVLIDTRFIGETQGIADGPDNIPKMGWGGIWFRSKYENGVRWVFGKLLAFNNFVIHFYNNIWSRLFLSDTSLSHQSFYFFSIWNIWKEGFKIQKQNLPWKATGKLWSSEQGNGNENLHVITLQRLRLFFGCEQKVFCSAVQPVLDDLLFDICISAMIQNRQDSIKLKSLSFRVVTPSNYINVCRWPPVRVVLKLTTVDNFSDVLSASYNDGSLGELEQSPMGPPEETPKEIMLTIHDKEQISPIREDAEAYNDVVIGLRGLAKLEVGLDPSTQKLIRPYIRVRRSLFTRVKRWESPPDFVDMIIMSVMSLQVSLSNVRHCQLINVIGFVMDVWWALLLMPLAILCQSLYSLTYTLK